MKDKIIDKFAKEILKNPEENQDEFAKKNSDKYHKKYSKNNNKTKGRMMHDVWCRIAEMEIMGEI